MNVLNKELKSINMKTYTVKTKCMIIGDINQSMHIQIENEEIEQVNKFKYLGGIINCRGDMEDEINERIASTGRLFNVIKSNFLSKKEIPKDVKAEIVKKIVKPTLTYSCESWVLTERLKSKINSMEMRFLRKIQGRSRKDKIRNEIYRKQLNIIPVEETVQQGQLRWLGHVYRMEEDRLVKKVFEARRMEKRKRGRPRRTWIEDVRAAVEARGIMWEEVRSIAMDRKKWKEKWKSAPIQEKK